MRRLALARPLSISLSFFLAASIALPLSLSTAGDAAAQPVSDADRASARQLYFAGVELQNAQKYAEALDRFERAQRVVNAPTNLLHIAECNAALNHLVEAEEGYQQLARYPLNASSPPAFRQAQDQGKSELAQMQPRIPELRVDVQPANVPTLTVTVDGQPVNSALIGVARPINPGVHKIVASAPGFTRAEQTVEVKEKIKNQSVVLNLQSTGGVIYGPAGAVPVGGGGGGGGGGAPAGGAGAPAGGAAGAPAGTTPAGTAPAGGAAGTTSAMTDANGNPIGAQGATPDKPAPYEAPPKKADTRSRMSIFVGPRFGVTTIGGNYASTSESTIIGTSSGSCDKCSFSDASTGGGAIGAEVAFRFVRLAYFGLVGEYESYGSKKDGNTGISGKTTSGLFAGKIGMITNPDGVAFMGDIGVGYRVFSVAFDQADGTNVSSTSPKGVEGELGVGMHIRAGKLMRIAPMFEFAVGSSTPQNAGQSVTGGSGLTSSSATVDKATYVVASFYISAFFDIDLDKRAKKAAAKDNGMQGITTW